MNLTLHALLKKATALSYRRSVAKRYALISFQETMPAGSLAADAGYAQQ